MSKLRHITATAAAALLLASSQTSHAAANSSDVLRRLISLDDSVRSYTADVRADIVMHSFPYLSPTLTGTYYHKQPNKDKFVFTGGVPLIANQFSNVYPHVESPSQWSSVYVISTERDDGNYTTFKLVPRRRARIDHIDAKVNDRTGELAQLRWNYTDSAYAYLDQSYGKVGNYTLVTRQSGHFQDPNYNADVTSSFSGFKLNVAIPDSVFNS